MFAFDRNKKICVIGAGKWGLNHVKTLQDLNSLGAVVDSKPEVLGYIAKNFPSCNTYKKLTDEIINSYDGFIISTDPSSHFNLAKKIIENKKHLLVDVYDLKSKEFIVVKDKGFNNGRLIIIKKY